MKLTPWLVLLSLSLAACSGSKSAQKVDEETPQVELSDADDFADTAGEEPIVESTENIAEEVPQSSLENAQPVVEESAPAVAATSNYVGNVEKQYTVQKNETLMLIAFKLYGDYGKWKELATYNQGLLKGATAVSAGMTLKYMAPAEEFVWNPQGLPYLIRTGDTLGTISNTVYTTPKKWKLIWNNNRPLIKDPNKIFAGFTLYYLENGREVANEM